MHQLTQRVGVAVRAPGGFFVVNVHGYEDQLGPEPKLVDVLLCVLTVHKP